MEMTAVTSMPFFTEESYTKYSLFPSFLDLIKQKDVEINGPLAPKNESSKTKKPCAEKQKGPSAQWQDILCAATKKPEKLHVPYLYPAVPFPRLSWLTKDDQKKFLELLEKYGSPGRPLGRTGEHKELLLLRDLQTKVLAEQAEYITYLQNAAFKLHKDYLHISEDADSYISDMLECRSKRVTRYPQFYVQDDSVSVRTPRQARELPFFHIKTLLNVGTVPEHAPISCGKKALKNKLRCDVKQLRKRIPPNPTQVSEKQVCSEDQTSEELALKHRVQVVISSSALNCLVDNHEPYHRQWEIPVVVKELHQKLESGESIKYKVAFIDKPFVQKQMSVRERSQCYHKVCLKYAYTHATHTGSFMREPEPNGNDIEFKYREEDKPQRHRSDSESYREAFMDDDKSGHGSTAIGADIEDLETFGTGPTKKSKMNLTEAVLLTRKQPVLQHSSPVIRVVDHCKVQIKSLENQSEPPTTVDQLEPATTSEGNQFEPAITSEVNQLKVDMNSKGNQSELVTTSERNQPETATDISCTEESPKTSLVKDVEKLISEKKNCQKDELEGSSNHKEVKQAVMLHENSTCSESESEALVILESDNDSALQIDIPKCDGSVDEESDIVPQCDGPSDTRKTKKQGKGKNKGKSIGKQGPVEKRMTTRKASKRRITGLKADQEVVTKRRASVETEQGKQGKTEDSESKTATYSKGAKLFKLKRAKASHVQEVMKKRCGSTKEMEKRGKTEEGESKTATHSERTKLFKLKRAKVSCSSRTGVKIVGQRRYGLKMSLSAEKASKLKARGIRKQDYVMMSRKGQTEKDHVLKASEIEGVVIEAHQKDGEKKGGRCGEVTTRKRRSSRKSVASMEGATVMEVDAQSGNMSHDQEIQKPGTGYHDDNGRKEDAEEHYTEVDSRRTCRRTGKGRRKSVRGMEKDGVSLNKTEARFEEVIHVTTEGCDTSMEIECDRLVEDRIAVGCGGDGAQSGDVDTKPSVVEINYRAFCEEQVKDQRSDKVVNIKEEEKEELEVQPVKRKRGRPSKKSLDQTRGQSLQRETMALQRPSLMVEGLQEVVVKQEAKEVGEVSLSKNSGAAGCSGDLSSKEALTVQKKRRGRPRKSKECRTSVTGKTVGVSVQDNEEVSVEAELASSHGDKDIDNKESDVKTVTPHHVTRTARKSHSDIVTVEGDSVEADAALGNGDKDIDNEEKDVRKVSSNRVTRTGRSLTTSVVVNCVGHSDIVRADVEGLELEDHSKKSRGVEEAVLSLKTMGRRKRDRPPLTRCASDTATLHTTGVEGNGQMVEKQPARRRTTRSKGRSASQSHIDTMADLESTVGGPRTLKSLGTSLGCGKKVEVSPNGTKEVDSAGNGEKDKELLDEHSPPGLQIEQTDAIAKAQIEELQEDLDLSVSEGSESEQEDILSPGGSKKSRRLYFSDEDSEEEERRRAQKAQKKWIDSVRQPARISQPVRRNSDPKQRDVGEGTEGDSTEMVKKPAIKVKSGTKKVFENLEIMPMNKPARKNLPNVKRNLQSLPKYKPPNVAEVEVSTFAECLPDVKPTYFGNTTKKRFSKHKHEMASDTSINLQLRQRIMRRRQNSNKLGQGKSETTKMENESTKKENESTNIESEYEGITLETEAVTFASAPESPKEHFKNQNPPLSPTPDRVFVWNPNTQTDKLQGPKVIPLEKVHCIAENNSATTLGYEHKSEHQEISSIAQLKLGIPSGITPLGYGNHSSETLHVDRSEASGSSVLAEHSLSDVSEFPETLVEPSSSSVGDPPVIQRRLSTTTDSQVKTRSCDYKSNISSDGLTVPMQRKTRVSLVSDGTSLQRDVTKSQLSNNASRTAIKQNQVKIKVRPKVKDTGVGILDRLLPVQHAVSACQSNKQGQQGGSTGLDNASCIGGDGKAATSLAYDCHVHHRTSVQQQGTSLEMTSHIHGHIGGDEKQVTSLNHHGHVDHGITVQQVAATILVQSFIKPVVSPPNDLSSGVQSRGVTTPAVVPNRSALVSEARDTIQQQRGHLPRENMAAHCLDTGHLSQESVKLREHFTSPPREIPAFVQPPHPFPVNMTHLYQAPVHRRDPKEWEMYEDPKDFENPPEGNMMYNLWQLGKLNVLIRCGVHTVKPKVTKDAPVNFLHFHPKLEYQRYHGYEQQTLSEISRSWINLAIRPRCNLYRVRIASKNSEVLREEEVDMAQILASANNFSPKASLDMLDGVFNKLCSLHPGHYLLGHARGNEQAHIKKTTQSQAGSYNLHMAYNNLRVDKEAVPWIPVDPSINLPFHLHYHRVPCTFEPKDTDKPFFRRDQDDKKFKKKGKKNRKKSKMIPNKK